MKKDDDIPTSLKSNTMKLHEAECLLHELVLKHAGISSQSIEGQEVQRKITDIQAYVVYLRGLADVDECSNASWELIPTWR